MQSTNTVTFAADDLHPHLQVLFLGLLAHAAKQPPLCRITVTDGKIRLATIFRRGAAGITCAANSTSSFDLAISAARAEAFQYLSGNVQFRADDGKFSYKTAGGASGSGGSYLAAFVPEVELPPVVGNASAANLGALLQLCEPFGKGAVARRGSVITAGDRQHSIAIDVASPELDWAISGDLIPLARSYLRLVRGQVELLGNETKIGLAAEQSWVVWPASLAPEVAPLRPATSTAEQLVLSSEAISTSAAWILAEVGEDHWFDFYLEDGEAKLGWRSGGEFVVGDVVAYVGTSPHRHLRLHGVDLGLLFRRRRRGDITLAIESRGEAIVLTSTETTEIDGEPATIRRSAVACIGHKGG